MYRSRDQVMYDELSASSAKYYHPMFSLTPREQTKRVYNLSYELIGSCIDRNLLKEGPVPNRILHNKELAIQVITTIDRVKQKIQDMFGLNLLTLSKEMTDIIDNEVEQEKEKEFDFLASAYTMLGNTTQSGYNKTKKTLYNNSIYQQRNFQVIIF